MKESYLSIMIYHIGQVGVGTGIMDYFHLCVTQIGVTPTSIILINIKGDCSSSFQSLPGSFLLQHSIMALTEEQKLGSKHARFRVREASE